MSRLKDADALKLAIDNGWKPDMMVSEIWDIIDEVPTVEVEPQWINVKDGLPEKLTLVLVCNHGIYDIAFVGDKGNWVNKLFEPEYWMPLPEAPKEVKE